MNVVLTIAGTDPSGAAGIQADLQVIRDHQMHGVSVITAVLAQNTQGVREIQPMSSALVAAQLDAVLADFDVSAVKVGLVPTDELVRLIAARVGHLPLVWDPVLSSGDGLTPLFDGSPDTLLDVLAQIDVFTPNIPEASLLLRRAVDSRNEAHRAAAELPCAGVLLKVGHLAHDGRIADIWADQAGSRDLAEVDAVADDVRGTGCHLSTAIACGIASGLDVVAAVDQARGYLNELLLNRAAKLGRGRRMIRHAVGREDDGGALLLDAARRGVRYRDGLLTRPARPSAASLEAMRHELAGDFPEHGAAAEAVLEVLDRVGSPATVASSGGKYLGYVVGGSLPVALAANWVATAWDQNAALVDMSPIAAHLDELAVSWLRQCLRLPGDTVGGLTTGATAANIVALAAARTHILERLGWDVEQRGLYGAPEIRVIVSECVHDSVRKALMVLGLGHGRTICVPTDEQGRMRLEGFPQLDDHTIVCAQAGHVYTGAFDFIGDIVERGGSSGAWVHVDGAFGLWGRASSRFDIVTAGIEQADSWSIDAHKWLNVPYDSGAVLTRHGQAIRRAMAAWLPLLAEERQPAAYTLEQSRRARGVDVWAALAHLGRSGVADLVEQTCTLARVLADSASELGLEVVNDVVLNQVMLSAGSDIQTAALFQRLHERGEIACSAATWKGRRLICLSVSSHRTGRAEIEAVAEALREAMSFARQ